MAGSTRTSMAFERALLSFKNKLLPNEIQAFTGSTLEDIRNEASAIQDLQLKKDGVIRGIRRIQPLINGLTQFSGVIEVFVQSKPAVLAFIWGPIKFLLQVASSYTEAFDELLNAFSTLGENLSRFHVYEMTFLDVPRMQDVIVMIYEDILRFYQVTLTFFRGKCWRRLFRSLWNTFNDRFGNILSELDRHKELVDKEASATHIAEARAARQAAQEAEETTRAYREKKNLLQIKMWLDPIDYDAFLARLRSPHSTAGVWFFQEDCVQTWLDMADTSKRLLWLTGIPGAGKTFLSASFLRHTCSIYGTNVPIAYAFLRHDSNITFAMIMLTLISQLLHHNLQQLAYFDKIRESKTHPPSSQKEIQEMFKFILENIGVSYIFIDGLDEIDIDMRKMVLDTLCHLLTEAENLKIFLSSRNEVDILTALTHFDKQIHRVDLAGKNQQDIKTYIAEEGKELFRIFSSDDDTRQQIQDILNEVCDKAEGMFLWAHLVIIDLKGQVDLEGLEDAARNLPVGLDAAYGRVLNRIKEKLSQNERDLARRVLGWVMCSTRPLSLSELKQAMAIREGDSCINKRRKILRRLDELCGPVIEIDVEDNVHFVHFTVKEYLTSSYGGRFIRHSDAHQDIATTCIRYLSFSCFDINTTDDEVKENVLSGEYCLHLYAERNWMYHVKHAIELDDDDSWTGSFASLLAGFVQLRLDKDLPQVANEDVPSEWRFLDRLSSSPNLQRHLINYCIFNSGEGLSKGILFDPLTLQKSTQRFRQHLEDIVTSSSTSNYQDQLQSIHRNYGEHIFKCSRVQCLHYVNGFDTRKRRDEHLNTHTRPFPCNIQGCDFVSFGFATIGALKVHLQRYHQTHVSGIDTQTQGHSSLGTFPPLGTLDLGKLLFDSICTGNVSKVKGVLELGVGLNSDSFNDNGESFLHYALSGGHKDIFQLLLEKGASPNTLNRQGTTILNSAISKGLIAYVKLLLQWGASVKGFRRWVDAKFEVNNISTPLLVAVQFGGKELVRLILKQGADLENQDANAALIHAVNRHNDNPDIIKILLEQGVSVNTVSPDGTSALILAIRKGHEKSVRLLLEQGADLEHQDANAALIHAVSGHNDYPNIIKILLEQGVNVNTVSPDGTPALILAIRKGHEKSVRLLLEQRLELKNQDASTALIETVSSSFGGADIIRILLEKGANVNTVSPDGTPALILAIKNRKKKSVLLLLEKGADVHSTDQDGVAALIHAISIPIKNPINTFSYESIVEILLEYGADVNTVSPGGIPALILAIVRGGKMSVRLLLKQGADVDSKDRVGVAALIHAINTPSSSESTAEILLEHGANANTVSLGGTPALILAIRQGHNKIVRLLLEKGAGVDSTDQAGDAALIYAIKISPFPELAAEILLKHGANANAVSLDGTPALILAVRKEHKITVRLLLEKGADADSTDLDGVTALIHAITTPLSSESTAEILLEHGANVNAVSPDGTPALILAIRQGHKKVRLLLEKGAGVDSTDRDGVAALIHAINAFPSSESTVEILLEHGVNVHTVSLDGTPAVVEAFRKSTSLAGQLVEKGAYIGAHWKDMYGEAAVISTKIGERTAMLFEAIYFGVIELVKRLIKTKINIKSTDDRTGARPLIAALLSPHYEHEILEILLNAGADVNFLPQRTDSAILLAVQRITADSGADTLGLLLKHGARIDMTLNRSGQTALHIMAENKNIFAARALLEHGARADILDKYGNTALTIWPDLLNQIIPSTSESQSSLESSVLLSVDES